MDPAAVYTKSPEFVQRDVAGECILVPIRRRLSESNSIYVLNDTGAALWKRIDGTKSVDAIMADFVDEFDVTLEQLKNDFTTLLDDLHSIHAVHPVPLPDE
jgi:hypothetical protein